jgi:hypothetical protein
MLLGFVLFCFFLFFIWDQTDPHADADPDPR